MEIENEINNFCGFLSNVKIMNFYRNIGYFIGNIEKMLVQFYVM